MNEWKEPPRDSATAQMGDLNEARHHHTATFSEMVERLGMKPRLLYPAKVVANVLGVPGTTVIEEMAAGRMKYHLPQGRKQGRMIRPEWVDEWLEEGTHEGF